MTTQSKKTAKAKQAKVATANDAPTVSTEIVGLPDNESSEETPNVTDASPEASEVFTTLTEGPAVSATPKKKRGRKPANKADFRTEDQPKFASVEDCAKWNSTIHTPLESEDFEKLSVYYRFKSNQYALKSAEYETEANDAARFEKLGDGNEAAAKVLRIQRQLAALQASLSDEEKAVLAEFAASS